MTRRRFGVDVTDQSELREELVHILELAGKRSELIQIFTSKFVIREIDLGVIIVDSLDERVIISDGGFGTPPGAISSSVWTSCSHDFFDFAPTLIESNRSAQEVTSPFSSSAFSHAVQRLSALRFPMPGKSLIIRLKATSSRGLATNADERDDIFDVCLLEESNAARDLIGNAATRQLQLQFDGVVMRAVKHRDVAQVNIFVAQFQDSLGDKLRLFASIVQCHQRRVEMTWIHASVSGFFGTV